MKPLLLFLFFGLFLCGSVKGQIKIGDNPQNIDASSVLELESNSRVLVITRINTEQMNAIVPSPGAIVYNTDEQCIHYFNGAQWINVCEEVGGIPNLTTDPLVNSISTLIITTAGENNHIEVAPNSIRSEQIVDGGINGVDIQDNSLGIEDLGIDSVGNEELAENAVGSEEIIDQAILPNDIAPSASPNYVLMTNITGTGVIWAAQDANNITGEDLTAGDGSIIVNTGAGATLVDASIMVANGGITTAKLGTDAVTTDKILDGTIASGDIATDAVNAATINSDVAGSGLVQNASGALEVDGTAITGDGDITSGDLTVGGDANALLGDITIEIAAGVVGNTELAANAVTTDKILDGTITASDLDADSVDATKINADVAGSGLVQNISGALEVDGTAITGDGDITSGDLTVGGDANALLGDVTLEITAGAVGNTELSADAVTTDKILDGTITTSDLDADSVDATKINADVAGSGLVQNISGALDVDGTAISGDGDIASADLTVGGDANALLGNVTLEITAGAVGNTELAANAVTTDKILDGTIASGDIATGAVTTAKIQDGQVQTADIADTNVTEAKINPSATDGQVLTTVAGNTQWATPTINIIATGGSIFFADGSNSLTFNSSQLFWDVTGSSGSGALGIGLTNPQNKLDVDGQIRARNGFASTGGTAGNPGYGFYTNGDTNMGMYRIISDQLGFSTNGIEAIRIDASQNVGIGIVPTTKLHVNGGIRAEGAITASGLITESVPDYVFEKYFKGYSKLNEGYNFLTLGELENYLEKNYHLPGIKSAKEVQKDGFWNLSASNIQNLEKIEELFLHTIEQEKKINKLKSENVTLSSELKLLRKDLDKIKEILKNK